MNFEVDRLLRITYTFDAAPPLNWRVSLRIILAKDNVPCPFEVRPPTRLVRATFVQHRFFTEVGVLCVVRCQNLLAKLAQIIYCIYTLP